MMCMNRRLTLLMTLIIVLAKNSDTMLKAHGEVGGVIYIRADGRVDPQTAPISSVDNVTYTFASDIDGSVKVQRNNIIVDGNGHTLKGPGDGIGIYLNGTSNVTIKRMIIQGFATDGINLYRAFNNTICDNTIQANSRHGIYLCYSLNITIAGNVIIGNDRYGLCLQFINGSTISGNNITNNYYGFYLDESHKNAIIGNIIASSDYYGINLYFSYDNTIAGNVINASSSYGIYLRLSSNINIAENTITNGKNNGVQLFESSNNILIGNDIAITKGDGIYLLDSSRNRVHGNNISSNMASGMSLISSSNNTISANTFLNNQNGIGIYDSMDDSIYHNNFIDNTHHCYSFASTNVWSNDVEGNYWGNYTGIDSNHDGIGDSYHILDADNIDYYPLMGIFYESSTSLSYNVNVISNSTIKYIEYSESERAIIIYTSNMIENQTFGFCRVCIPKDLMTPPYTVTINDGMIEVLHFNETIYANGTHRWIYFAYGCPTHEISIISNYSDYNSQLMLVALLITATLLAVVVSKVRERKSTVEKRA